MPRLPASPVVRQRGMTLIEILVVMVIIALMAAIMTVAVTGVGNVALWIRKLDDEGDGAKSVSVEAFANGCEGEPPMDSLLVSCADAEAIREENEVCED